MKQTLDRAPGVGSPPRWATLALTLAACATDDPATAGMATLSGDPVVAEVAGGQSGNEGSFTPTPCFGPQQMVVEAEVLQAEEGCMSLEVMALLTEAARMGGLVAGDVLHGKYAPYYTDDPSETGDRVVAVYTPGPNGAADASLQSVPLDGSVLHLEWRGASYDSSRDELQGEDCQALFLGRPHLEPDEPASELDPDGTDPTGALPGPLDCGGAP